jgi:DNA polymerase-3 subunit delta
MESLSFLDRASRLPIQPIYILHGDEDFLKRQVLASLRLRMFGEGGDDFGLAAYSGDSADFGRVRSELETLPFLCPYRLVIVDQADPFVTKYRAALEKYVAAPAAKGVLVLDVKSWAASTRLAKLVNDAGTIVCKAPPAYKLSAWCVQWAAAGHCKRLDRSAASLLVDLVGPEMGQLDQELTKLATAVGTNEVIATTDVDRLVGQSRTESTFKIFDAIAAGQPGEALAILDRVLTQGDEPLRILGALGLQLRRLAQASHLVQQGTPLGQAMNRLAVPPFARQSFEQQLRHLGPRRTDRLYPWLLEVELGLKGSSPLPPRTQLERLLVRLAAKEPASVRP